MSETYPIGVDAINVDMANGNNLEEEISLLKSTDINLQAEIESVASGSPAGVYSTVAALTSADPDHSKIYLVTANGH